MLCYFRCVLYPAWLRAVLNTSTKPSWFCCNLNYGRFTVWPWYSYLYSEYFIRGIITYIWPLVLLICIQTFQSYLINNIFTCIIKSESFKEKSATLPALPSSNYVYNLWSGLFIWCRAFCKYSYCFVNERFCGVDF